MTLEEALDRTLRLVETQLRPDAPRADVLQALTTTRVLLRAGHDTMATASGQGALVTAALAMARSGHEVWVDAPDVPMVGVQPPLSGTRLLPALAEVGADLLPTRVIAIGQPPGPLDVAFAFGAAPLPAAGVAWRLNARAWTARLLPLEAVEPWGTDDWPLGGLGAGYLAAGEAFKAAVRKLAHLAAGPLFTDLFAPCAGCTIELAPPGATRAAALGAFDIVSGGAITNAALFALLRLPGVTGHARILDKDTNGLSNLNRNALLLRSRLEAFKVEDLATYANGLVLEPMPVRYGGAWGDPVLRPRVLVGVDHIPSRWAAQAAGPAWLGVGATEEFSVLRTLHPAGAPCAACLHPHDPGSSEDPIPTCAFVSGWSGLLLATAFAREAAGAVLDAGAQQLFFTALRPESFDFGAMAGRADPRCRLACTASQAAEPRSTRAMSSPSARRPPGDA
jgi:hypothetical protein